MTLQEKIDKAAAVAGLTRAQLAKELGTSKQAFQKRWSTGKFRQDELEEIATVLGCEYRSGFYFPDGKRVE